ncbi:MAG: transporter [Cytophagales bacterium]|nr:MAG: transporter [Cytophagales bacterium]TAF59758.1 MAG: transporter [Cytophagales bacterium]
MKFFLAAILLLCTSYSSKIFAQEAKDSTHLKTNQDELAFSTDRPGIAESPFIIPTRSLQLEWGYNNEWQRSETAGMKSTASTITVSSLLLRFAVHQRIELRLTHDLAYNTLIIKQPSSKEKTDIQAAPLRGGIKINFTKNKGIIPEFSLLSEYFIPGTSGKTFDIEKLGMSHRLIAQNALTSRMNLCYNVGFDMDYDAASEKYTNTPYYMIGTDYSITDNLAVFIEAYGYMGEEPDHRWNTGITYVVFPRFQLDMSVGAKYNGFDAGFFNTGVSYRFLR